VFLWYETRTDIRGWYLWSETESEDILIGGSTDPVQIPPSLFDSAFEVVGSVDAYNDIYDWMFANTSWYGWSTNWMVSAALALTNKLSGITNVIYLEFADDTTMTLKLLDFSLSEMSFKFEYHYAEDENGNVIPDPLGNYSPDEGVGWRVGDFISNGGYSAQNPNGTPYAGGWAGGHCYAVSCTLGPKICVVTDTQCP
jgi:hypothetical protein